MTYTCETACQYAMDVGMPEYSGITNGTCGNCAHYAPVERECAICYPRGVQCQGECDGLREATHEVVTGRRRDYTGTFDVFKLMCHTCAVNERTEKDWSKTDD